MDPLQRLAAGQLAHRLELRRRRPTDASLEGRQR
jgi:hypothetical protein